jgi:soluble lytic murein transglycosylase
MIPDVSAPIGRDVFQQSVLADPALEAVKLALEARDDELASAALNDALERSGADAIQQLRWRYLLGVIERRRGDSIRAMAAFREVSRTQGPLRREAATHLVETALSVSDCVNARLGLEVLGMDPSPKALWDGYAASVFRCEKKGLEAEQLYRAALAGEVVGIRSATLKVELAELLLDRVGPCTARQSEVEAEVVTLLKEAAELGATSDALGTRVSEATSRLACSIEGVRVPVLGASSVTYVDFLLSKRRYREAKELLAALQAEGVWASGQVEFACRVELASARLASATALEREARERFEWIASHCAERDEAARALFLLAGTHVSAGQPALALTRYAELVARFPSHRLADDAHLKQARLYRSMGSEKQYVEYLDELPERFPKGDMTQEGLFELALFSMLKRQWGAAQLVLDRAERLAEGGGPIRDAERDRLRYFRARVWLELKDSAKGLTGLQRLIVERPMGYYMLMAHEVLRAIEPARAAEAVQVGLAIARNQVPVSPNAFGPEIERIVVLLAAGDWERASEALLQLPETERIADAYFTLAGLYIQAGAHPAALAILKGKISGYRDRWPVGAWTEHWQMAYPRPYGSIVRKEATRLNVPEALVYAIMREESEFDPTALSPANAYGLMQLILPTARTASRKTGHVATPKTLLRPETNIPIGVKVLSELLARFRGQVPLVAAGYNAGPGRPKRWLRERPELASDLWIEAIEYAETRSYVKRVVGSLAVYRWLYGDTDNRETVTPLPLVFAE